VLTIALASSACAGRRANAEPVADAAPVASAPSSLPSVAPHAASAEATCPAVARPTLPAPDATLVDPAAVALEDPDGAALARFHRALARLLRGRAKDHLRIAVIGDSNTTEDFLTGALRRPLQRALGDAGHGYVALAKPVPGYFHQDVRHGLIEDVWSVRAISQVRLDDGVYGFGGVAAISKGGGAKTWVETALASAPVGTRIDRVEVLWADRLGGGDFEVRADGAPLATLDASAKSPAEERVEARAFSLTDGPHRVDFVAKHGQVRLLGAVLERTPASVGRASVVVDCLGVDSLNYRLLGLHDPKALAASLRARQYDLIVFWLGTNVCIPKAHDGWMRAALALFREAAPDVDFLVMGPPDRTHDRHAGTFEATTRQCTDSMRPIAREKGAAFWDFQRAMGGEGAVLAFQRRGLVAGDGLHLTPKGGEQMGARLLRALFDDLDAALSKSPELGCEEGARPPSP
jgi:hypothetical protein